MLLVVDVALISHRLISKYLTMLPLLIKGLLAAATSPALTIKTIRYFAAAVDLIELIDLQLEAIVFVIPLVLGVFCRILKIALYIAARHWVILR